MTKVSLECINKFKCHWLCNKPHKALVVRLESCTQSNMLLVGDMLMFEYCLTCVKTNPGLYNTWPCVSFPQSEETQRKRKKQQDEDQGLKLYTWHKIVDHPLTDKMNYCYQSQVALITSKCLIIVDMRMLDIHLSVTLFVSPKQITLSVLHRDLHKGEK